MKRQLLQLVFLSVIVNLVAQPNGQWRGPQRDGIYNETGLLKTWPAEGPKMLWHFDDLGAGFTSAAVTSELIYITGVKSNDGYLYAFTQDGNLVWKALYGKEWVENFPGSRSTPVFFNGKLYFMSGLGVVYCLNATNGQLVWSIDLIEKYGARNLMFGMTENLLIHNNKLYVAAGGEEHNILALNIENGNLIWTSKGVGGKSSYNSPLMIISNGIDILVSHSDTSIVGINAEDGTLFWSFGFRNTYNIHPNTPIYNNGMLFCFSGYGKGGVMLKLSADGKSVTQVWENKRIDNQMGGAVLLDGKIYLTGHNNKRMYCVDWLSGKEILAGTKNITATSISADGLIYSYSEAGNVHLIKPTDSGFEMVSEFKVPFGTEQHWAHLVIVNKKLYVRHGTSLMVYEIAQ